MKVITSFIYAICRPLKKILLNIIISILIQPRTNISIPQNRQFCKILVTDIPKYMSLSSFDYKKFCEKSFLLNKVIKKKRFYE